MKLDVLEAIELERDYQERKHPGSTHTVSEWLLIMEQCFLKAKSAWNGNGGDQAALNEIRQVAAVGVACMEEHGAPLR